MSTVDGFREYLDALDAATRLNRIDEAVSWNLEASAITMLANERDDRIPLFESVADVGANVRLVGDPYRGDRDRPWSTVARALGLPADLDGDEYYELVMQRLADPIDPVRVEDAVCKENVRRGPEVNLLEFPWPYIHAGDGGRYSNLQTLVAPDPDSEWVDWATHRAMIQNDERASLLLLAGEQIPNLYYYKYEAQGKPMPVAIVIGADPSVDFVSSMWIPTGRSEAEFAGGLKREPIELVECETSDLLVPASAELVVEGRVLPDERLDEGPFGDYFGYMNGPRRSMPVLAVDAVTYRDDAIIPFCVEGSGVGHSLNTSATMEFACVGPDATLGLHAAGFDVERCTPWKFTPRTVYTVSTNVPRPGYLHELANFIFTTWGMLHIDFFIFVDADVDPLDTRAVLEAIALYADPDTDFHQFGVERMPKVPLNIYQTPAEKGDAATGTSKAKTAKAYIDATTSNCDAVSTTLPDGEGDELRERARSVLATVGFDPTDVDAADAEGDVSYTEEGEIDE